MKNNNSKIWCTFSLLTLILSFRAQAVDHCYYGKVIRDNKNTSDTYYYYDATRSKDQDFRNNICNQTVIDRYWNKFGMQKYYWDDGMGYYDVCNVSKPLARTLTAIWVLENSKNSSFPSDYLLNSAYSHAGNKISHLQIKCGDGGANASYFLGYATMYWPGIYGMNVVGRGGTILHEARHREKIHNAFSNCPSKGSCDSDWNYNGANTWKALYLWWYGYYGRNSTSTLRNFALDEAQYIIDNRFKTSPGYKVR